MTPHATAYESGGGLDSRRREVPPRSSHSSLASQWCTLRRMEDKKPAEPIDPIALMRLEEAASWLKVSVATIRRWCSQGILEGVQLPNRGRRVTQISVARIVLEQFERKWEATNDR